MTFNKSRRRWLQLLLAGSAGLSAYAYQRGIRFPKLSLEPSQPASRFKLSGAEISLTNLIQTSNRTDYHATLRAFAPEPEITIKAAHHQVLKLRVNNIAADAALQYSPAADIKEQVEGISRILEIQPGEQETLTLRWQLPALQSYSFAAIGDSGGGTELDWCIQRAYQLGARFLLHLGDFNYQAGDYENAIRLFNEAPLPCYVCIGNHDFHAAGLVYHKFLEEIGPFNHQFTIGNTRFVNLDTAASILPWSGGQRGRLIQDLIKDQTPYADTVTFTHRPLVDPQGDSDHDIGSTAERDWLIKNLTSAGIQTLLSGHIHIFARSEIQGIDNIIVGQGLGHQDLLVNADHSKIALGKVDDAGHVNYEFAPLAMPMEMHCSARSDLVKQSLKNAPHADAIEEIDRACARSSQ